MFLHNKIEMPQLLAAVKHAQVLFPLKNMVILFDNMPFQNQSSAIDCRINNVDILRYIDFRDTIFIYACESDEIGSPFIEAIIQNKGFFLPVSVATPSLYTHINETARLIIEAEYQRQSEAGFAKWDFGPHDFINIIQAIDITAHLVGDFLEIGCFRGSSGCVAMRYMHQKKMKRNCYFFDYFEGFTYRQALESSDTFWQGTHKTEGYSVVEERLKLFENPATGLNALVHKINIIDDNLPESIRSICLANIDVDMYEAVFASLIKVAPLITQGGIIIVEDPGHTPLLIGARVALNQFLSSSDGDDFTPIYMQSGQTFLIKKQKTINETTS